MGLFSMNEAEWWDRFGTLNNRVWEYDPYINSVIRSEYLTEMQKFLYKPGGKLLDFGCGTGWFSMPFALQGMTVDAIDNSAEQILRGKELALKYNAAGIIFTFDTDIPSVQNHYDAVLLHALIHHIPIHDRINLLEKVQRVLTPEGRLYIYEPIFQQANPPPPALVADLVMGGIFRLMRYLARYAHLYAPDIRAAIQDGWTMRSPTEQPGTLDQLKRLLPAEMSLVSVQAWHIWSINYANFCMMLRPNWRKLFKRGLPAFYKLDRWARGKTWSPYLRCWPCVSLKAQKKG